jgi:hypothetical protein
MVCIHQYLAPCPTTRTPGTFAELTKRQTGTMSLILVPVWSTLDLRLDPWSWIWYCGEELRL